MRSYLHTIAPSSSSSIQLFFSSRLRTRSVDGNLNASEMAMTASLRILQSERLCVWSGVEPNFNASPMALEPSVPIRLKPRLRILKCRMAQLLALGQLVGLVQLLTLAHLLAVAQLLGVVQLLTLDFWLFNFWLWLNCRNFNASPTIAIPPAGPKTFTPRYRTRPI